MIDLLQVTRRLCLSAQIYFEKYIQNNRIQTSQYKSLYMKQSLAKIPKVLLETAYRKYPISAKLIRLGFRGINTGNNYIMHTLKSREGLGQAIVKSEIPRNQLFIQSKYQYFQNQSQMSVNKSAMYTMRKLNINYIDSFVLEYPEQYQGEFFRVDSRVVWGHFEKLVQQGKVHYLGVSSCYNLKFLQEFYNQTTIKPRFLLNKLQQFPKFSERDRQLLKFCNENGIQYQTYWLYYHTYNLNKMDSFKFQHLQKKYNRTSSEIIFSVFIQMNIMLLVGQKLCFNQKVSDLSILYLELEKDDIKEVWSKLNE